MCPRDVLRRVLVARFALVLAEDDLNIRGLDLGYWAHEVALVSVVGACQHLYRELTILLTAGDSAGFEIVWMILGD